ncbi:MAG TPA: helix-turn-helix domain-containing protein [Hyphomonadaceae bacterium]|jgi:AcrR family transcriptional regulator|nr:helix-turn-helix domain-containing protein [Hyphomonadaceae bacterium]
MAKPKKPAPEASSRDREATEKRIIEAAARVMARDGAAALGINAIAAEAGADKKLIYRYFGGLDGLLEALGAETGVWIGELSPAAKGNYGQRMLAAFTAYADKLRGDAVLQKLLAWELAGPSPALARIEAARSKAMFGVMMKVRGEETPPPGADAPAINAIVLAALNYLVLRSASMGNFSGMPLKTEADWKRVTAALEGILAKVYEK